MNEDTKQGILGIHVDRYILYPFVLQTYPIFKLFVSSWLFKERFYGDSENKENCGADVMKVSCGK
jgi:hypothetical protein